VGKLNGGARKLDLVNHSKAKVETMVKAGTAFVQVGKTAWTIYRIAKVGLVAAGPVGWGVLAASFLADFAIEYVAGKVVDKVTEFAAEKMTSGHVGVATGSPNVTTNNRDAVRGENADKACHGDMVVQGSEWVSINQKPASRLDDMTTNGHISSASTNVLIGGPPTEYDRFKNWNRAMFALDLVSSAKVGAIKGMVKKAGVWKSVAKEVGKTAANKGMEEATDWAGDKAKNWWNGW
jgi:uncharacterized Zn-binding protein involved in type VI secretion